MSTATTHAARFNASAWALTHKPLVGFLMVLLTLAGLSAYNELGRDEDPPFTMKTMIVKAYWPGADAETTALQLTDRLEKAVEPLQWLDTVTSYTMAGESTLFVTLRDDAPPKDVPDQWYQTRKRIGDLATTLPDGTVGPFYNDDFGDVYGVIYALTSDGFTQRELRDYAEQIRADLLRVEGAGKVDLIGLQDEVLNVEFSTREMAGLGISMDTISSALRAQNAVVASGSVETANERIAIRVSGRLDSLETLRNVPIRAGDRQVRLRDIAQVTRQYEDPPGPQFRYNGQPAIGIGVAMRKGGNILELGEALDADMNRIESQLPAGVDVHLVADQPSVVHDSVGDFTHALFEAIVIVLVVSFVSLGLRAGAVVAVSIPLVLAITFVFMQALDISLQRISLGALVIALGLLVDDAMIAVEMMVKKLEEGSSRFAAATFAYTSTAFPMLTGTLVSVAGFLPVGFARSAAGEYCFTLFAVVAIALLVSWIVAVIFTPFLGVGLLKESPTPHTHSAGHEGRLTLAFRRTLLAALNRRKLVIGGTVAAFVLSVLLFGKVEQQFFPASDRPELLVDLRLAQNASLEATEAQVHRFEQILAKDPDVVQHTFYVGTGAVRFYLPLNVQLETPNFAQAVVVTKGYEARDRVRERLERVLESEFDTLMARVQPLALGPPVEWPIQYRVSGADIGEVRRLSERVAESIRGNPDIRLVNFNWNELSKSVQIEIDQDKARQLGLTSEQAAATLNAALSGRVVTQMREDTYLIDVRGRASASERGDLQALRDLAIMAPSGRTVPLAQIAQFRYGLEESTIWRRDRLPTITVQADIPNDKQAATVIAGLDDTIGELRAQLPPGYRLEVGGTVGESAKGEASIMAVVPVMAIVMLVILMLQLHSTQKLLLVMLTAPLGLIGVALALFASDRPFGFVAMLGMFALTGMIIRNAVVLMAQIKENEDAGLAPFPAIVEATMHRLRPILLTAAAAILGLIPIANDVFWGPMAFAMMGGLLIATVLTLLFLPALYATWFRVPVRNP